jgi:hypothetical protein
MASSLSILPESLIHLGRNAGDRKFYYPITSQAPRTSAQERRNPLQHDPHHPDESILWTANVHMPGNRAAIVKLNGPEAPGFNRQGGTQRKLYTAHYSWPGSGAKVSQFGMRFWFPSTEHLHREASSAYSTYSLKFRHKRIAMTRDWSPNRHSSFPWAPPP